MHRGEVKSISGSSYYSLIPLLFATLLGLFSSLGWVFSCDS